MALADLFEIFFRMPGTNPEWEIEAQKNLCQIFFFFKFKKLPKTEGLDYERINSSCQSIVIGDVAT